MTIIFEITLSAEQVLVAWDAVSVVLSQRPELLPTGSLENLHRWAVQHQNDSSDLTVTSSYDFLPDGEAQRLRITALEELSLLSVPKIRVKFSEQATGIGS